MLSIQTVEPHTLELLKSLSAEPVLAQTRLVGGTALALQLGHRSSIDLDFFGSVDDDEQEIHEALTRAGKWSVTSEKKNIKCYIVDGVKIDIVNYAYPWIDAPVESDGFTLASPKDIAAMKINAIIGRGTKKDFIDIFFLLKQYSLSELLDFYKHKYPEYSIFRALMSLSYFDDAEHQDMPKMFAEAKWETIKAEISKHVDNYTR